MSHSARRSILVAADAGHASAPLLCSTLRLHWALTVQEAEGVLADGDADVCVTRESMAPALLAAARRLDRSIEFIVLLDSQNHAEWGGYFEAGATSLVPSSAADRIAEALQDATGVNIESLDGEMTVDHDPLQTLTAVLRGEMAAWDAPRWLMRASERLSAEERTAIRDERRDPRSLGARTAARADLLREKCLSEGPTHALGA